MSKQFYQDFGFELISDNNGTSYFKSGETSFLLQDFYEEIHAQNFMMHLLVEDIRQFHTKLKKSGLESKYKTNISDITKQAWGMYDFVIKDPTGVLWRIGQLID